MTKDVSVKYIFYIAVVLSGAGFMQSGQINVFHYLSWDHICPTACGSQLISTLQYIMQ